MFKTSRQRLILSHLLPLLVIMPIVGIALIYFLETRVLVPGLVRELTGQAELVGELAGDRPEIWQNQTEAEIFARTTSEHTLAQVVLLNPEGRLLASGDSIDPAYLNDLVDPSVSVPGDALAGRMKVQTTYSDRLQTGIVEVWLPVSGADGQAQGIIQLSRRLFTVEEQFARLRYFIAGILLAGLALGSLVGLVLALDAERLFRQMTHTVYLLTAGRPQKPLPEHIPQEIRAAIELLGPDQSGEKL